MIHLMLNDLVLLLPEPVEERVGNVVIPIAAQPTHLRGTVVALGPRRADAKGYKLIEGLYIAPGGEPTEIAEGDEVIYTPFCNPQEVYVGGDKHLVIRRQDIMAVVRGVPAGDIFAG